MLLTQEQLNQIANHFDLPVKEGLPIRDGVVKPDQNVWWRCEEGPELVKAHQHWYNIKDFPHLYQFDKPEFTVGYL